MKKFNFKLESVLKLRSHKVDLAKSELGKIIAQKNLKKEEIKQREQEISDHESNDSNSSLSYLQNRFYRISQLHSEIENIKLEIDNIKEIEEVKRKQLNEVLKDEKIMEKLKEKELESYNDKLKKEENEFIEEIASRKYMIKNEY